MASGLLDDYLRAKIDLPWLNLDFFGQYDYIFLE